MNFTFGQPTAKSVSFGQPTTMNPIQNANNNGLSTIGTSVIQPQNTGFNAKPAGTGFTFGTTQQPSTSFGTAQPAQPSTAPTTSFGMIGKPATGTGFGTGAFDGGFGTGGFGTGGGAFGGGAFGPQAQKHGPQPAEYCAELVDASLKYDQALQLNQLQKSGLQAAQLALSATSHGFRSSNANVNQDSFIHSSMGIHLQQSGPVFKRLNSSFRTSAFGDQSQKHEIDPDKNMMDLMKKSFAIQKQRRQQQKESELLASRRNDAETEQEDEIPQPDPFYQAHGMFPGRKEQNQDDNNGKILRYRNMYGEVEFLERVTAPQAFVLEDVIDLRHGFVGLKDVVRCPFLTGKWARITLYNISPPGGEKHLREYCEKNAGRFIKYDPESKNWTFDLEMW